MKIAAVVVGLFVAALAYLSYKGFIDVKWIAMENVTRSTLTNVAGQAVHELNNTANTICSTSICNSSIRATRCSYVRICPGTSGGFQERVTGGENTQMNKLPIIIILSALIPIFLSISP